MRLLGSLGDYEEKRGCTQTQYAACVSLVMQLGETDDSGDDEDDGDGWTVIMILMILIAAMMMLMMIRMVVRCLRFS
jgi:hypothetical protein